MKNKSNRPNLWKTGVIAGGITLASLLNPSQAYSQVQDYIKTDYVSKLTDEQKLNIQRGVYKPTLKDSTDTHYIFEFKFNKDLENALKNTKEPKLALTGNAAKGSYIKFNADTTAAELYYSKEYFNKQGIGENIGIAWIHEGKSIDLCSPNIPGSKTNPLSSFYWNPSRFSYEQPQKEPQPKEPEQPREGKLEKECCDETTIINNSITNNYYGDTTKIPTIYIPKDSCKNFRIIAEAGKDLNTPFANAKIAPYIKLLEKGDFSLWTGPYLKLFAGKEHSYSRNEWNEKTMLEQEIDLFTVSQGFEELTKNKKLLQELGWDISAMYKNFEGVLGFGLRNKKLEESFFKKGFDGIYQGDKTIKEKPFCVDDFKEEEFKNWMINASINYHIIKNFYAGAGANLNLTDKELEVLLKLGINLGGCSK
jgi:hypothetical protein